MHDDDDDDDVVPDSLSLVRHTVRHWLPAHSMHIPKVTGTCAITRPLVPPRSIALACVTPSRKIPGGMETHFSASLRMAAGFLTNERASCPQSDSHVYLKLDLIKDTIAEEALQRPSRRRHSSSASICDCLLVLHTQWYSTNAHVGAAAACTNQWYSTNNLDRYYRTDYKTLLPEEPTSWKPPFTR